jgi:DNA polymerase-3 subunit epsilon
MLHAGLLRRSVDSSRAGADPVDWPARIRRLATQAEDGRLTAYSAAGCVEGDTSRAAAPLVALDIETTGLDPARDGIVSIGLVPMSLERIRASASRHWIVKPRVALATESVTVHGITDSQVQAAPDLLHILDELLQQMAGQVMVVHCREIERQFLDQALRARIGEGIEFPVIDTMELEARLHRRHRPGWLDRLRGRTANKVSIRLADSRRRYGLPRYRPHHAMTDALSSAELLQAQVAHRFSPETPMRDLWR